MSDILLRAQVRVQTALYSLRHRQEGQGLVEYGLIIASIAILLIVAMLFLAGKIDDLFSETVRSLDRAGAFVCGPPSRVLAQSTRSASRNRPDGQLRREAPDATLSSVHMDIDTTTPTGAVGRLELREGGPSAMRDVILRAQVRVQTALYSIRHRQEGQGLVEYGLIDDLFSETGSSVESGGPLP